MERENMYEVAVIDDYYFVEGQNKIRFVDYRCSKELFCLVGSVTDKELENGSFITTSPVVSMSGSTVTTKSGTCYILKDMNTDYVDFLEAKENNIPIISLWNIDRFDSGRLILFGSTDSGKAVAGKIVFQKDNLVILKDMVGRHQQFFVDWKTPSKSCARLLPLFEDLCNLPYPKNFEMFAGFVCKPILF